jgi:hypothetical protein
MSNKLSLFIVGLPRSGTKLLRELLNNHDNIFIPSIEAYFIPHLTKEWGGQVLGREDVKEVLEEIKKSLFFFYYAKNRYFNFEKFISEGITVKELIGDIWRELSIKRNKGTAKVLGDKTPRNVYQLPFLLSSFPEAKFIHIVRDPRDNVLSVKNTWNKNIFRAAYKWQQGIDSVKGINEDRGRLAEITYEKLLRDTEAVLRQLSAFIGISYQDGMDKLQKKVEGKGGEIDQKNFDKYLGVCRTFRI